MHSGNFLRPFVISLASGTALALLVGCHRGAAQKPPPPPTVTVAPVEKKEIVEWQEFTGCELLMTDPTVWITSDAHALHEQRPIPIAISDDPECSDFAMRLLDVRGLPYRVAVRCSTIGNLGVAVQSGLAIAPFSRSNIPIGCRELTLADGFGDTDAARVVMHQNMRSGGEAVESMARAIRNAFARSAIA